MTGFRVNKSKASLIKVVLAFVFIVGALIAAEAIANSESEKQLESHTNAFE
ncbi:hypothetical protein HUO09_18270 [Vibrio sp. Y2-5]|uniref:hypothetical protein n=1 Tax=Vibrio TaxID=662 RepID=UPI00142DAF13|nr:MULTISPECIES: hypothetical protein [Vibrio]MBD0788307.1 hypothetical protein [Vibrio sp. Y2-5]NIY91985.1 hypothetical protein [Vibrio diazotrophicus]